MNKHKLVQIIVNDLEELKALTEEITETQNDSSIIIELALSKSRLVCQEFELLRKCASESSSLQEEIENEDIDFSTSDPELEILNFEEQKPEEEKELVFGYQGEEDEEYDHKNLELEFENDLDEEVEDEPLQELEQDDSASLAEEQPEEESIDEEIVNDESLPEPNDEVSDFEKAPQPEVREIHIEDLDDEDSEPISFSTQASSAAQPVMREIPKPEESVIEKTVIGETFQKERSLNDTIGENKSAETSLGNGPISSLRTAIGLNDRFLFIREIFGNNTDKYNKIIDHLDKLETIQQAVEYLKANLTLQKNDTSIKFVDLLKRRFSK